MLKTVVDEEPAGSDPENHASSGWRVEGVEDGYGGKAGGTEVDDVRLGVSDGLRSPAGPGNDLVVEGGGPAIVWSSGKGEVEGGVPAVRSAHAESVSAGRRGGYRAISGS